MHTPLALTADEATTLDACSRPMPKLSVIVPCYYNEDNNPVTLCELVANEANFPAEVSFEYVFVNDGSGDNTLVVLRRAQAQQPGRVRIVDLASNVGSYNTIVAGLAQATTWPLLRPTCRIHRH